MRVGFGEARKARRLFLLDYHESMRSTRPGVAVEKNSNFIDYAGQAQEVAGESNWRSRRLIRAAPPLQLGQAMSANTRLFPPSRCRGLQSRPKGACTQLAALRSTR